MSKKKARWRKLDNAAKLYSAASNKKDTRVFRFYCELKEEVNPDVLQEALNQTIEIFPTFLMVLRKGLFWHYLEPCNLRPIVKEEYKEPCSRLYIKDKKTLLFEVTYYKKRINFEVFHVLTDGTGATEFLKELVKNYLYLIHKVNGLEPVSLLPEDMTVQDQEVDSFLKYYSKDQKRPKKRKLHAFQIRRKKKDGNHLHVHESVVSVQAVLKRSRELGVSMTVFLTALFMMAINEEMSKKINNSLDYIPLQFIIEYLKVLGYCAFAFKSSRGTGFNYILFSETKIEVLNTKVIEVCDIGYTYKTKEILIPEEAN